MNLELKENSFSYELGINKNFRSTVSRNKVIKMISENYDKKISRVDILTTTGVSRSVLDGLEQLKVIKKNLIEQENLSKPKITFSKTLTKKLSLIHI